MLSLWEEVTVQFLYSAPDKKSVDAFCTLNVLPTYQSLTAAYQLKPKLVPQIIIWFIKEQKRVILS